MPTISEAFARQAASDMATYEVLANTSLPCCHRLHSLQMWLEKLCKSHIHDTNLPVDALSHGVIAKVLPCREIDLLQPPVKAGGRREDNVEYPWCSAAGTVHYPAQYDFAVAGRLQSQPGKLLLKVATLLTRNPSIFLAS